MADVRDALMVARNSKGELIRRPLSPHVQIYRPQWSWVPSILHRVTGIALSVGTLLLVWWLVAAATSPESFARVQGFIGSPFGYLLLFGWTVALFYHFFAGIRHLFWDFGQGFEKPLFHQTAKALFVATAACTVVLWIIGIVVK